MSKLLIVTATLGGAKWFKYTYESIRGLKDHGVDLQWIVVCSPESINNLKSCYPDLECIEETGRSLYAGINQGIAYADTNWEWFTYINDDDGFLPSFVDLWNEVSVEPLIDFAYADVEYVDEYGKSSGLASVCRFPSDILPLYAIDLPPLTQQGVLVRRRVFEALSGFDCRLSHAADADFFVRALAAGFKAKYKNCTTAFYRNRPGQLSSNVAQMHKDRAVVANTAMGALGSRLFWPAKMRFRLFNLGRILRRIRRRGFVTTSSMFGRTS